MSYLSYIMQENIDIDIHRLFVCPVFGRVFHVFGRLDCQQSMMRQTLRRNPNNILIG